MAGGEEGVGVPEEFPAHIEGVLRQLAVQDTPFGARPRSLADAVGNLNRLRQALRAAVAGQMGLSVPASGGTVPMLAAAPPPSPPPPLVPPGVAPLQALARPSGARPPGPGATAAGARAPARTIPRAAPRPMALSPTTSLESYGHVPVGRTEQLRALQPTPTYLGDSADPPEAISEREYRLGDQVRNRRMSPEQLHSYLTEKRRYFRQRAQHPEWAPYDPPAGADPPGLLPRNPGGLTWGVGKPWFDASPMPARRYDTGMITSAQMGRIYPQSETRLRDTGGGELAIDRRWYDDHITRIRNRWGLRAVHDEVDPRGRRVHVYTTPETIQCNRVVAPHLIAALDELDARGLLHLVTTISGYHPRLERGGSDPSQHTYGIAFDINQLDYPQLTGKAYDAARKHGRLRDQDGRLIAVMQEHGFFYGGDYQYVDKDGRSRYPEVVRQNTDAMHFEFADPTALSP